MDHTQFQEWLSGIDQLSATQRLQAEAVFLGASDRSASLAAVETSVGEDRQCSHCGTPGAVSRGKARGLRRYQCKGRSKNHGTFRSTSSGPGRSSDCPAVEWGRNVEGEIKILRCTI